MRSLLVTGGAGFVGAHLALASKRARPASRVVALDNLCRRGSERNLERLAAGGVEFVHGDVRCRTDLEAIAGDFELIVDAAADPSVTAGLGGSPESLVATNLLGTVHTLELAGS